MGGGAALYYAFILGLRGAIVAAPQVDIVSVKAHKFRNWEKHIKAIASQWVDLDILSMRYNRLPYIYIEYGEYNADALAVEKLIDSLKRNRRPMILVNKYECEEHFISEYLRKNSVLNLISLFEGVNKNVSA